MPAARARQPVSAATMAPSWWAIKCTIAC